MPGEPRTVFTKPQLIWSYRVDCCCAALYFGCCVTFDNFVFRSKLRYWCAFSAPQPNLVLKNCVTHVRPVRKRRGSARSAKTNANFRNQIAGVSRMLKSGQLRAAAFCSRSSIPSTPSRRAASTPCTARTTTFWAAPGKTVLFELGRSAAVRRRVQARKAEQESRLHQPAQVCSMLTLLFARTAACRHRALCQERLHA